MEERNLQSVTQLLEPAIVMQARADGLIHEAGRRARHFVGSDWPIVLVAKSE